MMKFKVGGYCRVSTEEQAALVDGSLDNQKYRINAFVDLKNMQEKNWGQIQEFYVDEGFSAKDTRRPAFQRMIADLRRGKIDLILVTDLSRLSRSISDFCVILDLLKSHNSSFLSIKEQFDSSTPPGKMMLYNMINLAQFEREQTAERVALGCHARAMRGLLNGGQAILGYDKIPEKKNSFTVNENESEIVRKIFKTYLEEGSLSRTIRRLEEMGIKPKPHAKRKQKIVDRGLWTSSLLRELLMNYSYIGMMEVNKRKRDLDAKQLKSHELHQIVKASWDGIVKKEDFESVQKLLAENRSRERRRLEGAVRRVFLVSGIVHCKECGRAMVGQSSHGQKSVHRYYKHGESKGDTNICSVKRIRAEDVEDAISKHLFKMLDDGGYLNEISERIASIEKETFGSTKAIRSQMEKELRTISNEMESAFKLQMSCPADSEAAKFCVAKMESLGTQKKEIEKRLSAVKETDTNVISISQAKKNLYERTEAVTRGWSKIPEAQKRKALRRLIKQVLIGPQGMDIYYYYNSLAEERSLGVFTLEKANPAKVIAFGSRGTESVALGIDSKQQVGNCLLLDMVIAARLERATYCLEGSCSIQLSYATILE
tara:strand:- start:180541 stop:182340 length:1800 start_codon:yes stop_codon:yes gene_type:complete